MLCRGCCFLSLTRLPFSFCIPFPGKSAATLRWRDPLSHIFFVPFRQAGSGWVSWLREKNWGLPQPPPAVSIMCTENTVITFRNMQLESQDQIASLIKDCYLLPSFELLSLLILIAFSFQNYHDIFNDTSLARTYFQVPYTGQPGY